MAQTFPFCANGGIAEHNDYSITTYNIGYDVMEHHMPCLPISWRTDRAVYRNTSKLQIIYNDN